MTPPRATWLGSQRIALGTCGSTNDEGGRLARGGASHGTVIIADAQTAGRGREDRRWESPPGTGLYLSAITRPSLPLAQVPPMTLAIGIGVCDAARQLGAAAELKWPNDVLVRGKKLAGVLVEAQSQGPRLDAVVIGIGMNLADDPPPAVAATATSLAQATALHYENPLALRDHVVEILLGHVQHWLDRYSAAGLAVIIDAWQARMAPGLAARATIGGEQLVGTVAGLDGDGALLLRDRVGALHRVRSGDVEVIRGTPPPESSAGAC